MNPAQVLAGLALGGVVLAAVARRARALGPATGSDRNAVLAAFTSRGYPAPEADRVIQFESGWRASAVNPHTHAAGLIQIMPFGLPYVGWHDGYAAFAKLTASEQAPYIARYLDNVGKRWKYPGDTYVAIAAPAFVGAPPGTVAYPAGSDEAVANPAWQDASGAVTVDSIRRIVA